MKRNLLLCAALFSCVLLSSCAGDGTGIGGSGIHGEVNTNYAPATGEVTVGGKIYFTKRPLTLKERDAIAVESRQTGAKWAAADDATRSHQKDLLARRLAYRYRVYASIIRKTSDPAFDAGARGN